jgi:hypothetical protein
MSGRDDDRGQHDGWRDFVRQHGGAPAETLAHVVGHTADDVRRVRSGVVCARKTKCRSFGDLFVKWHGRPPADDEWPTPARLAGGGYEWQTPELALVATQVGQASVPEIADLLTKRLRALTGSPEAIRTRAAVQSRIALLGLQARDVVGGLTVAEAAREVGSRTIVQEAVRHGHLRTRKVGSVLVIPRDQWAAWKARRSAPPEGYVQLSTLKPVICPGTDKLVEYAGLSYIPSAVKCFPMQGGIPSTSRGTWFISPQVAEQLLADRRAGRPMPWFGKPTPSNLKATYRLLQQRMHPVHCAECRKIWGNEGAPKSFENYALRYPPLEHGAKRHLTRPWVPGLTIAETARHCGASTSNVRRAITNGTLTARTIDGRLFVTRTDATRWRARRCPTGEGTKSWISLDTAVCCYLFTKRELQSLIAEGRLRSKVGSDGAMRGIVYVLRHQCGQLRERTGFSVEEAARRASVSVARMTALLSGAHWRQEDERVPLETLQTVIKRLQSKPGLSVPAAAAALGVEASWIMARVNDGTVRLTLDKWGSKESCVTPPMMRRLERALSSPESVKRLDPREWYGLVEATADAGVSAATLIKWAAAGDVERREDKGRWRYGRASLRRRAATYWATCRFKRAARPAWLAVES